MNSHFSNTSIIIRQSEIDIMDSNQQPCIMCVICFLDTLTGLLYMGDSVDLVHITTLCLGLHIRSKNVEKIHK